MKVKPGVSEMKTWERERNKDDRLQGVVKRTESMMIVIETNVNCGTAT